MTTGSRARSTRLVLARLELAEPVTGVAVMPEDMVTKPTTKGESTVKNFILKKSEGRRVQSVIKWCVVVK